MNLLVLNAETKLPELSAEALTISEFRIIWDKVNPIDGDRTGEKKHYNLKQIGYIYFIHSYDSRYRHDDDREEKIRELLDLPKDWQPEAIVLKAAAKYVETIYIPALDTVDEMKETLKATKSWLKIKKLAITAGNLSPMDIKSVMTLIDDMPETVESLKRAEKILYDQQMSNSSGRKGRALGKWERKLEIPVKRSI